MKLNQQTSVELKNRGKGKGERSYQVAFELTFIEVPCIVKELPSSMFLVVLPFAFILSHAICVISAEEYTRALADTYKSINVIPTTLF